MRFLSAICVFLAALVCATLAADPKEIVNKHNDHRLEIARGTLQGQPRGINLKRFKWDNYLAQKAQEIANRCIFEHVRVDDERWSVGQNLLAGSGPRRENWSMPIDDAWWKENKAYRYSNQYQPGTGHYTQMIWANTEYVGCAFAYCPNVKWTNIFVCNYGPAGNSGGYPYNTGSSGCSNLC